ARQGRAAAAVPACRYAGVCVGRGPHPVPSARAAGAGAVRGPGSPGGLKEPADGAAVAASPANRGFAPVWSGRKAPRRRWASISQRVGAGRADEVVLGKAADIVGGETHHAAVIVDTQIGVVVFPVGHEGQRIHERHGPVVIVEHESPNHGTAFIRAYTTGAMTLQLAGAGLTLPAIAT